MDSADTIDIREELDWDGVSRPIVDAVTTGAMDPGAVIAAADVLIDRAKEAQFLVEQWAWVTFRVADAKIEVGDGWVYAAGGPAWERQLLIESKYWDEEDFPLSWAARDDLPVAHQEGEEHYREVRIKFRA